MLCFENDDKTDAVQSEDPFLWGLTQASILHWHGWVPFNYLSPKCSSCCMRFCSSPLHLKVSHFLFWFKYNTQHRPASNFWWAKARSGNSSCFADDCWWLLLHVPHAFHSYSNASNLMCSCNPAFHFKTKRKKQTNKQKNPNKPEKLFSLSSVSVQPSLSLKRPQEFTSEDLVADLQTSLF